MGKYTEMVPATGKYSAMLSPEQPQQDNKSDAFKTAFPKYEAPKVGTQVRQTVLTPQQVRDYSSKNTNDVADFSGKPTEYYSSIANARFFSDQFHITPDDSVSQELLIGRALYGNKDLSSSQINALLNQDVNSGNFERRAALAKWKQFGVDDNTAKDLDALYHSDWMDSARFYTGAVPRGIARAFTGTVAGAGDLFGADTPMVDEFNKRQDEFTQDYLNDALIRGNYLDYIAGQSTKTAGDVAGNLYLMGKAIKAANAWTGGKMSLVAKGKTWKELAKNTGKRSLFLAGLNFVKTEGTVKDKWNSAMLTMAYMNTPIISSMSPTHSQAFLADFVLNSGISASYNPQKKEFEFGGQYKEAWEEAGDMAEEIGRPEDRNTIFVGMALPILGSDVAFSALTRSIRQNTDLPQMKSFLETQRVIESKATASTAEMGRALQSKYGDGWEFTMSEADSIRYNAIKTIESAEKSGGIPEEKLVSETGDTKARVEVADDKVYFRDADGELKPVAISDDKVLPPTEKEAIKEQGERDKYIKNINKKSPVQFDFEYRKSIDDIQKSLVGGLSKKKLSEFESVKDYLKENPDAKLPPKLLSKLDKIPVQKLSTDELKVISDEVDRLRQIGKTKYKLAQKQRKESLSLESKEISENFKTPSKGVAKKRTEEKVTGKKKRAPSLKFVEERPSRFFDRLDGARGRFDGPAHKRFVDRVNEDAARELENIDARTQGFEKVLSDIKTNAKDLGRKVLVAGNKFTIEQILGIYALSKNRLSYNAMRHGNFKGMEDPDKVIDTAKEMVESDPKLKTIADYIIYDFASNTHRVFDAIGKHEGKLPSLEEFYIPMERTDVTRETSMDDVHKQVMQRQDVIKNSPKDDFKINREVLPDDYQSPINLSLLDLWERNVSLQEHYINNVGNVKDMRTIAQDKQFRDNLRDSYGDEAGKYIDEYVDVVANPMAIYSQKSFDVLSRRLRKNIATAYLAGNVKTMIKQSPSLAFYLGETRPDYLVGSLAEMQGAWRSEDGRLKNTVIDFVAEKDPLVKHSHIQRELAELRIQDKGKYDQVMNQIGEVGFKGIIEIDKAVRSAGWYAVYKYQKEVNGASESEAIREARNATLRTQPTARAQDLPPIYRTNEGLNWLLMFSNQLNQIWNMTTKDVPRRLKNSSDRGKALAQTAGLATSAMAMWAINNGKPLPENEAELGEIFSDQFTASVPIVGNFIMQGAKGYSSGNPVSETFERGGKLFFKLQNGEEIEQKEYYDLFFRGVAPASGVPTTAINRGLKFAESGELSELTGIKKKD